MSLRETVQTIEDLLKDESLGLRPRYESFLDAQGLLGQPGPFRSDFNFVKWTLADRARPTTRPNVMVRPRRWVTSLRYSGTPLRDSGDVIEIGFETFSASPDDVQNELIYVATALAQTLDGLREYSDARGGTVIDIASFAEGRQLDFEMGAFSGATSNGFICRFTVNEESQND